MAKKVFIIFLSLFLLSLTACHERPPRPRQHDTPAVADLPEQPEAPPEIPDDETETENPWWDDLISDEFPQEFWENQARYGAVAQRVNGLFPIEDDGWSVIYPDFFGGLYLNDMGILTVLMVEDLVETTDAMDFRAAVEEFGGSSFRNVEFSQQELLDVMDILSDMWQDNPVMQNVRGMGMDTIGNRIDIYLLLGDEEHIAEFRREVMDSPMLAFSGTRGSVLVLDDLAEPLRYNPLLTNVLMEVTDYSNLPNEITVTISNNSPYMIMTGYPFLVEAYYNGSWWQVPMSGMFILMGITIDTGETYDFVKDLSFNVGPLERGFYRIRKDVFRDIDTPINDGDIHEIVAEFTIY